MKGIEHAWTANTFPSPELAELLFTASAPPAAHSAKLLVGQNQDDDAELVQEQDYAKRFKASTAGSKMQQHSSRPQHLQTTTTTFSTRLPKSAVDTIMEEAKTTLDAAAADTMKSRYELQATCLSISYAHECINVLQQATAQASLRGERQMQQLPKVKELHAAMINAVTSGQQPGQEFWRQFVSLPQNHVAWVERENLDLICRLGKTWTADSPQRLQIERQVANGLKIRFLAIRELLENRTKDWGSLIELRSRPTSRVNGEHLPHEEAAAVAVTVADPYVCYLNKSDITLDQKRCIYPSWYKYQKSMSALNNQIVAAQAVIANGISDEKLNIINNGTSLRARGQLFCSMIEAADFLDNLKLQILRLYSALMLGIVRELTPIQHVTLLVECYPITPNWIRFCSLLFAEQPPHVDAAASASVAATPPQSMPLLPSFRHDSN